MTLKQINETSWIYTSSKGEEQPLEEVNNFQFLGAYSKALFDDNFPPKHTDILRKEIARRMDDRYEKGK